MMTVPAPPTEPIEDWIKAQVDRFMDSVDNVSVAVSIKRWPSPEVVCVQFIRGPNIVEKLIPDIELQMIYDPENVLRAKIALMYAEIMSTGD